MASASIALPKVNRAELLKIIGLPSEREQAARIADGAGELVRTVVSVIDNLVTACIERRTANEFLQKRNEVFPQYFVAMRALGDLTKIVLPKQAIERLVAESFSEMEADFRELGPPTFGTDLTERGMFTVWTLRKIHDLAQEIVASPIPIEDDSKNKDNEMAMEFVTLAVWNRFHVDCLTKSMRAKKPLYPEVVEPIRDGLRAAVNAYACIRRWADLRNPKAEPVLSHVEWSEEDECLLADSMRDLEQELD
ncbi:MAG TPA: hypothetical protein VLY24_30755 [Bryobacteraceae bacterium]|nr:hypothetical protein [Bryobacteraceae bacterium]